MSTTEEGQDVVLRPSRPTDEGGVRHLASSPSCGHYVLSLQLVNGMLYMGRHCSTLAYVKLPTVSVRTDPTTWVEQWNQAPWSEIVSKPGAHGQSLAATGGPDDVLGVTDAPALLWVGFRSKHVGVYDVQRATFVHMEAVHNAWVRAFCRVDANTIVSCSGEKPRLVVWDITTFKQTTMVLPDGQSFEHSIHCADVYDGHLWYGDTSGSVGCVTRAPGPPSRWMRLSLWKDPDTTHVTAIHVRRPSPGYRHRPMVFSGCDDGAVRVWTLDGRSLVRHKHHRYAVKTLSSRRNVLASGSNDGMVIVYSLITNNVLCQLVNHSNWVRQLIWYNDVLISASDDGTVRVFAGFHKYKEYVGARPQVTALFICWLRKAPHLSLLPKDVVREIALWVWTP